MFLRLLWRLLDGNRGRLLVALTALVSGATVISALMNLRLDVERKLTQEFRTLGANVVISPPQVRGLDAASPSLMDESVLRTIDAANLRDVEAAAPYLYVVAQTRSMSPQAVIVAGTWLDQAPKLQPWWKIQGQAILSHEDRVHCLVGRNAARLFQVVPGGTLALGVASRSVSLLVAGIVDAGGNEDNQVFVNLPVAQQLAGLPGRIEFVQLSVSAASQDIRRDVSRLAAVLPSLDVQPIRQIAEGEGKLLGRIHLLIVLTGLLILALTSLCVLATMTALALERRRDVGLMKALGGSIRRVMALFLAEVSILGAAGGALGYLLGLGLSVWMGRQIFGAEISPRPEVFPLTVILMVIVTLAGALPLRSLGRLRPAVILRGE